MSGTLDLRFDAKVYRTTDCWLWTGHIDPAGYGRIREGGRSTPVLYAHRYSYERNVGPIPEGLEIDHICRVRHCVNPSHLEAVPHRVNALRGDAPTIVLHRSGRCKRGHSRADALLRKDGRVAYCAKCRAEKRAAGEWK